MKADAKTEAEVMAVFNQLIEAFAKRDLDSGLALFAPDPDVVFIGTGKDEKSIGLAENKAHIERAFAQSEEASIQLGWHLVSAAGSVAWLAADATINAKVNGKELSFPVRWTIVMERRGGKWLVVQSHDSLPAASQKEGESWPSQRW